MATVVYTTDAVNDLREIRDFLTLNAGPEATARFLDGIEIAFDRLAELPHSGRARPEYDPDVRSCPFGQYVIFYFPRPFGVSIARVYHSSRNPDQVF